MNSNRFRDSTCRVSRTSGPSCTRLAIVLVVRVVQVVRAARVVLEAKAEKAPNDTSGADVASSPLQKFSSFPRPAPFSGECGVLSALSSRSTRGGLRRSRAEV